MHPRAVAIFAIVCILRFELLESIFVTAGGVISMRSAKSFFLRLSAFIRRKTSDSKSSASFSTVFS